MKCFEKFGSFVLSSKHITYAIHRIVFHRIGGFLFLLSECFEVQCDALEIFNCSSNASIVERSLSLGEDTKTN